MPCPTWWATSAARSACAGVDASRPTSSAASRCDDARDGLGRLNRQLRVLPILPIDAGAALGIKAQVLGWFSAHALPMAASGVLAVSVLSGPMVDLPPRSPDPAADGGIESPGTASFQPTATPAPDDQALAPQPATSRERTLHADADADDGDRRASDQLDASSRRGAGRTLAVGRPAG